MTTDGGLLVVRELDEAPGLTEMARGMLSEARANNRRHDLAGLFRQSVYARLAGYEDVNDQEALSRDPATRAAVGRKALERNAAGTAAVSRFETEILAAEGDLGSAGRHQRRLDIKSAGFHRKQEGHPGHGLLGVPGA